MLKINVEYVDHYGSDLMVANAARRSFGIDNKEWSEVPRSERGRSDRELVESLGSDGHLLPFRHPHITLSCDAPIPVARQLGKHQVGFDWSEISRRYKTKGITIERGLIWRKSGDVRQGTGEELDTTTQFLASELYNGSVNRTYKEYNQLLAMGITPEQARYILPQGMEVSWTWTGSLLAWSDLYNKRQHQDTQLETREFVKQVANIIEPLYPVSWKALTNGSIH